jgi:hypothetical protein
MTSSRRDALKALGVTVAVATLGGAGVLANAAAPERSRAAAGARKAAIKAAALRPGSFAGLEGAQLASCTVVEVGAIEHGSVPVTFVDTNGANFTVDVLRHDAQSPGVSQAGSLAVFMRGGHGQTATHEEHGLAAMALAGELARRETAGAVVPSLLTLQERAVVRAAWNVRETASRNS